MNVHDDDDFERFLAGDLAAGGDFASFADLDDSSPVQPNAALAQVLSEGFGTERVALVGDLGARRRRRTYAMRCGAGVAAATLVFGGAAAAGSLPDSVQTFASKVAGVVGISIPRPGDDGRKIQPPADSDVPETDVPAIDDDTDLIDDDPVTTVEVDTDVDDDPVATVEVDSDVDDDPVTTVEVDDEADDDEMNDDPVTTPEIDDELNDDPASQPEEDAELDDDETVVQPEDDAADDDPVVGQSEDDLGADDPVDA